MPSATNSFEKDLGGWFKMRSISQLCKPGIKTMRDLAELSTDPNTTKYTTTGITDMQPEIWSKEVVKFGEALRILDQLVLVNKEMVGTKSEKVTIAKTTSHLSITTSPIDTTYPEGTVRNFTEMTNVDTVSATMLVTDFLKGGITISKEAFMTVQMDLISQARFTIAQDLADDVDLALATAIQSTSVTNTLWGGDATQVEDLTAGDVLTTDLIADARAQIRLNNFVPKSIVISTYQEATLMKDSQFVNASEYGSNEVVLKGEIGKYLGLKVIVTTNANFSYTTGDTEVNENASPGADMNVVPVLADTKAGQKASVMLAWKEMPHIDFEYEKNEARHIIYYDQGFTTALIHAEAISLIKVTQA